MKMNSKNKLLSKYREKSINDESNNTSSYFLEKSLTIADNVVMVMPKFLLNTSEYTKTRDYISKLNIKSIIDFGEKGFEGVLIETICININTFNKPSNTKVLSITLKEEINQKQNYIIDNKLPYWIIYRNEEFDKLLKKMDFNIFDVFRDRQITNNNSSKAKKDIWIIKSRNINDDATEINHIADYDQYINEDDIKNYNVYEFLNNKNIYITPNMSYKPRVCKKPTGTIVNGSVAILIPKNNIKLTKKDMLFYATDEYRNFYKIARNYQTRSLNIDKTSVFFFGKLKEA
jgi:DNA (cytosine-5)-methyltransferase 1